MTEHEGVLFGVCVCACVYWGKWGLLCTHRGKVHEWITLEISLLSIKRAEATRPLHKMLIANIRHTNLVKMRLGDKDEAE